ncbi:MAG: tRNA 2-selenouridine(34) synthase MnmH [Firmicutes bacterium HGW-Firmicutes-1]|jgi:tRNA 2-selenouridine synthase|nr:MAG: tRNA 2-selenouridine(34) synthase MnmH [Firmicutes bacterium HGW-Firmicutes-1]
MNQYEWKDFERIVIDEIPLIDVRAPIEFEKGSFINAVNLPLMNDEERHLVGICYKEKGNEEAVLLGHQLVSGEIRQARINSWKTHLDQYPNSLIYCFRGGLRSQISQQWIEEATGKKIHRLEGGYKVFRNYLIKALEPSQQKSKPILIGGCTGVGKTILLKKLDYAIDLESIANHRGSSFGKQLEPQPSQINFENNLAYALLQHRHKDHRYMILEDEGYNVGRCLIPRPLAEYFKGGELVILEASFEDRVHNTLNEYVIQSQALYRKAYGGEQGMVEWSNYIRDSIKRIKNRLGGDRYKKVLDFFEHAYQEQLYSGGFHLHKNWVEMLLRDYYDPMYNYQIEKTTSKIVFKGNDDQVFAYLENKLFDK